MPKPSYAWSTQARMAHASRLGQLKKVEVEDSFSKLGSIRVGMICHTSRSSLFKLISYQNYIKTFRLGKP